ncbi:ABC transporter ATP-binding protein [Granulicella sibirica]|uniref:Oligopeptide ABC transporter ATP-binding protein n=1 Tax=Granulicella sibirica TaxID=2479048 RepID=A0A4Q0T6X0_9BACT|nr:ABC transporter ATP-binding protein [Granulicella sibirica]RXH57341.1 oligopeptide ABC transporter ATP-binding protein [Granulicella sibirica]
MSEGAIPLLRVSLQASYGRQSVLRDIRLDLEKGESLGLVGTSGAGKSTLILALLGLLPWRGGTVTGEVLLEGQNLLTMPERDARRLRGSRIALIPQSPMNALNAVVSLRAHFDEAWRAHDNRGRAALETRLATLLSEVQLPTDPSFLKRKPGEISVGQAQRVMIALALLHRPAILVADEPTSALDPVTQAEILKLLRHLNQTMGTTLLYISHDLLSVLQLCDRIAVLDTGTIVELLSVDRIEQAVHPATLALLNALPAPPRILLEYRDGNAR